MIRVTGPAGYAGRRAVLGGVLAAAVWSAAYTPSARAAATDQWLVVVTGLSGEERFRRQFHEQATSLIDAAVTRWGMPEDQVVYLAEDPSLDPARITGRSTGEQIRASLTNVAAHTAPGDAVVIVLIGHGSGGEGEPKLNLPGRDLTAHEWARLLDPLEGRSVAFINAASASGGFIEEISAPNRITITATRSGRERTETRFAEFFVEAFAEQGADTDKDGGISMLEAFEYAREEVARSYEEEGILLTEHALLDDDGDGSGTQEPDPATGDGAVARRFFLGEVAGAPAGVTGMPTGADPELVALYAEKSRLEGAIEDLKALRETMSEADYEDSLETLLVDLALTTRDIERVEEGTR